MNTEQLTNEQIEQLSEHFVVDVEDIEELDYDTYGLLNVEIGAETYLLAENYEEAEKAAADSIREFFDEIPSGFALWALCDNSEISYNAMEDLIKHEANEAIRELVDVDGLIDDCISSDGIGHTLSTYDSDEIEVEGMYLYRID